MSADRRHGAGRQPDPERSRLRGSPAVATVERMTSGPTDQGSQATAANLLDRALSQTSAVLAGVRDDQLATPTPCDDWTVARLVDHLVSAPTRFAAMMRGERPDFTSAPQVGTDREERFRAAGDELLDAWRSPELAARGNLAWQLAELAVHSWDLATATGQPVDSLDPEVAMVGLDFMRASLTPENRSRAFRPEQPAPEDAGAYERIAAFAGRRTRSASALP